MNRNTKGVRYALVILAFAALLTITSFTAFGTQPAQAADGDETKTASIIVQTGDTDAAIREVQFTDTISGLKALELSGFDYVAENYSWGWAICSIEGVGCPADDCFCGGSTYWGYNYWDGSTWQGYPVGVADSVITQTGSFDGYRWGEWGSTLVTATVAESAQDALGWMAEQQSGKDGGDGSMASSMDALLAVGSNHIPADDWKRYDWAPSLMDFVAQEGAGYSKQGVAQAGKLAVSVVAGQGCWPPDAMKPSDYYSSTIDAMGEVAGELSWAIMGTLAISDTLPGDSVGKLKSLANPDGGWSISAVFDRDTNTTALAIQALVAAGESVTSTEVISGLAFLKTAQNDDGGFTYDPVSAWGTDSDTNSTAYVIQAILAAGQDPSGDAWTKSGKNGYDYLATTQLESGAFEWQTGYGANSMSTQQAVPALLVTTWPPESMELDECKLDYRWIYYLPETASAHSID